jgi:hypothetical protein
MASRLGKVIRIAWRLSEGGKRASSCGLRHGCRPARSLRAARRAVRLLGSWLQSVAQAWLVYRLTGSSFQLGLVIFIGQSRPSTGITPERAYNSE